MPPNYCPDCGTQITDRQASDCPSCGHDFVEEDDLFDDDDLDDDFDDLDEDEDEEDDDDNVDQSRSTSEATSSFASALVHSPPVVAVRQSELIASGGFWDTLIGKGIRWIAFLPVAAVLLFLIEIVAALFFVWLFGGSMRMFVVIGILLGGLFMILPLAAMAYYGVVILATQMICPAPRVGSIIFATLYVLGSIQPFITVIASDWDAASKVTVVLLKIVFFFAALGAVSQAYSESR